MYFYKGLTSKAIGLYILLIIATQIVFIGRALPALPMIFGLLQVTGFFYFLYYLSIKWIKHTPAILVKNIFRYSLIIRLIYVFASYYFFLLMTGQPFEYAAADSVGYHELAIWYASMLKTGSLTGYLMGMQTISDTGYAVYLSIIYFFTGDSILIARVIKAILSAYTAVLIYKIAYRNFGESAARLAGIMAMLLPNFIYYTGMHLKETEMVFLTVAFAERADYLLKAARVRIKDILITLLLGFSLFFFRTVLGAAAIFSFLTAILLARGRYHNFQKRVQLLFVLLVFAALVTGSTLVNEVNKYWGERTTNQEIGMTSRHTGAGSQFLKYTKASIFAPIILFAPFPALVNIPDQQNFMLINGAYFTRNVYAFFILIALFFIYKEKSYRKYLFIISFLFTYLAILAASTFALSERFHLPALPFLIIFASYGITKINNKNAKFYIPYLVLIFVIVMAWNWVKLTSRGL